MPKPISARVFVALIVIWGFLDVAEAMLDAHSLTTVRWAVFLALATIAARFKVKLPGLTGTMSINLPFILLAAAVMGRPEAVIVAFVSTFAQSLPRGMQKLNLVQVAFNCCAMTLSITAASLLYAWPAMTARVGSTGIRLAVAAAGYFLVNTMVVATVIAFSEKANLGRVWTEMVQLSYPYLVASAGVAGLALTVGRPWGWQVPLAVLPVMLGVFYSYRRYFAASSPEPLISAQMETAGAAAGAQL